LKIFIAITSWAIRRLGRAPARQIRATFFVSWSRPYYTRIFVRGRRAKR